MKPMARFESVYDLETLIDPVAVSLLTEYPPNENTGRGYECRVGLIGGQELCVKGTMREVLQRLNRPVDVS